jgi:hypothetical protein
MRLVAQIGRRTVVAPGELRCLIYCRHIYFNKKWGVISTMTTRYRLLLVAASIISVAAVPACYTLVRHPRLASHDYRRPDDKQCAECHSGKEIWAFNHAPRRPTYVGYANTWVEYYDVAWWYKRAWKYSPHEGLTAIPHQRFPTVEVSADSTAVSSDWFTEKGNIGASGHADANKRPVEKNEEDRADDK